MITGYATSSTVREGINNEILLVQSGLVNGKLKSDVWLDKQVDITVAKILIYKKINRQVIDNSGRGEIYWKGIVS